MTSHECLLFFVKWPEPGKVKTRLAMSLGDHHAVGLYRCFILDMLEALAQNPQPIHICYAPEDAEQNFKRWLGPTYHYLPQSGQDLGAKMRQSFKNAFQLGFQSVCLVGSDLPGLPPTYMNQAFEGLHQYDSVIGPTHDGGYYLIGFRQTTFFPGIFQDVRWSQPTVCQETLRKYAQHGTRFFTLSPWDDLDNLHDLKQWHRHHQNDERLAPRTCAYVRHLHEYEQMDDHC